MKTPFKQYCLKQDPGYKIFDEELFQNLHLYMHNQPNKYDNSKGLLFLGKVGCGKTLLCKLLSEYGYKVGGLYNVYDIIEDIDNFSYYTNGMNLCLDDIGNEPQFNQIYGNKYNVVETIIIRFYDKAFQEGFYFSGTSNLTKLQLKERYSERVVDRLREMVNIISLNNKSFRK